MRIREMASGLQFPEGPVAMADGSVILVEIARGTLSRVTPDGRIQVLANLGGGPNGAALGQMAPCTCATTAGFVLPPRLMASCDPWHRRTITQAAA